MPFTPDDSLIDKLCDVLVEHANSDPKHNAQNLLYLAGITSGAGGFMLRSGVYAQGLIEGMSRKAQAEADAEMLDQDPPGIDQWGTNGGKEPDDNEGC